MWKAWIKKRAIASLDMNRVLLLVVLFCLLLFGGIRYCYEVPVSQAFLDAYAAKVNEIEAEQALFENRWRKQHTGRATLLREAKKVIYKRLTKDIFPAWKGTKWDFNGTTTTPRKGKIACGYFVTTTLKQVGWSLPRRKLAQEPSSSIIHSFCAPKSIKYWANLKQLEQYLDKYEQGLFILGLDTHVGYVWVEGGKHYFVHASRSGKNSVQLEPIQEAKVVLKSKTLMLGNLLDNKAIVKKWIQRQPVAIRKAS